LYVGVGEARNLSGVAINMSVDLPSTPIALHFARASTEVAALRVLNSSRGSLIERFWEFDDGETSN
jgi:hypothetical protein